VSLAEIVERLDQISQVWRSDTSAEQRLDSADLDDLLEQLDEVEPETAAATERIDELRGRIEILMDEIEISLGIEPAVIAAEDAGESDQYGPSRRR
jgi:ribosome assembly protein YihI (activator of Der GTPase)